MVGRTPHSLGMAAGHQAGAGTHLALGQRLLGQVALPFHLDLHRLRDVGDHKVEDPAGGEHHVLGAGLV